MIYDVLTPQVVSATPGFVGLVLIGYWLRDKRSALALALLATPLSLLDTGFRSLKAPRNGRAG